MDIHPARLADGGIAETIAPISRQIWDAKYRLPRKCRLQNAVLSRSTRSQRHFSSGDKGFALGTGMSSGSLRA